MPAQVTQPHSPPLVTSSVWRCESTQQADQLLQGELPGYVYQRDGHPNADLLLTKCAELHAAEADALNNVGWVDQGKGIVRLPIADAVLLAEKQWQNPAQARATLNDRVEKAFYVPPPPPPKPSAFE